MVIMASRIARGRVRTTTAMELRNMAAILQIIGWQRYLLISITWPYRGLKCTAHRGLAFFWSWPLTKCWFLIELRAHVRLTRWKQGRVVRKPVNASPGLKFIRIITFSSIQMFFAALFEFRVTDKTQNRKLNSKQKISPQSYKTRINILRSTFNILPGLAQSGIEQLSQRATLLGWPKSIIYYM